MIPMLEDDTASFPWNAVERLINDRCFSNNRDTGPTSLDLSLKLYVEEAEGMPWNDSPVLKSGIISEKLEEWGEICICFKWPI